MPSRRVVPLPKGWDRLREKILIRYAALCYVCGASQCYQVDHVIPSSRGGTDAEDNLRPICDDCHKKKTARESGRVSNRREKEVHPSLQRK